MLPPNTNLAAPQVPPDQPAADARKIIYTAEMQITVEDFGKAADKLEQLVKDSKGYIARQNVHGSPGSPRSGSWTVRVPIEQFDAFRHAIRQVGELADSRIESREVTEEYVDLTARLDTKTKTKKRLEQHLDNKTAKLEEVLKVEEQLDRVDEELEKVKGRMRLLDDLIALTTVTVVLSERTKYVPPESTTFGTNLGRTFQDSLTLMVETGQNLLLFVVAIGPWALLLAAIGIPVWRISKRFSRNRPAVARGTGNPASTPPS